MTQQDQTVAIVAREPRSNPIVGNRGVEITSFSELWSVANAIHKSGFAPSSLRTPEAVFVALEMGLEVGLKPMAAMRSIAVINGRAAIYGDAALALVRASGLLESFDERIVGEGDQRKAICTVYRKGARRPKESTFSVADATLAKLWGQKDGPWKQYPERMLLFRARGFCLRDEFGDVLQGLITAEEAGDMPPATESPSHGVGLREAIDRAGEIIDQPTPPPQAAQAAAIAASTSVAPESPQAAKAATPPPPRAVQDWFDQPEAGKPAGSKSIQFDATKEYPPESGLIKTATKPDSQPVEDTVAPVPVAIPLSGPGVPVGPKELIALLEANAGFIAECEPTRAKAGLPKQFFNPAICKAVKLGNKAGPRSLVLADKTKVDIQQAIAERRGVFACPESEIIPPEPAAT